MVATMRKPAGIEARGALGGVIVPACLTVGEAVILAGARCGLVELHPLAFLIARWRLACLCRVGAAGASSTVSSDGGGHA